MTAVAILERLTAQGLHLARRGENIVVTPKAAATPEVVDLIRTHKPELLAVLPEAKAMTAGERAELTRLVNLVADANGWTETDRAEALAVAIEHQQLDLFRTLASELRTHQDEAHRQVASKAQAHSSGPYVKPDGYECATFSVPTSHGWYQFVVEIPAAQYDPFALWDLYRKHRVIH